jgi:hypothetical protein
MIRVARSDLEQKFTGQRLADYLASGTLAPSHGERDEATGIRARPAGDWRWCRSAAAAALRERRSGLTTPRQPCRRCLSNSKPLETLSIIDDSVGLEARVGIGQGTPIHCEEYRKFPHKCKENSV